MHAWRRLLLKALCCVSSIRSHEQSHQPPHRRVIVFETGDELRIGQRRRKALDEQLLRSIVIRESQVAANDVLEQSRRWLFVEDAHHLRQAIGYGHEPLRRCTDVVQTDIIEQNLLQDEGGDRLGQLRSRLHRPKAQRNELGRQQKVNHMRIIDLDERSHDSQTGEAEVFEGTTRIGGVEKGIDVEDEMRWRQTSHHREMWLLMG